MFDNERDDPAKGSRFSLCPAARRFLQSRTRPSGQPHRSLTGVSPYWPVQQERQRAGRRDSRAGLFPGTNIPTHSSYWHERLVLANEPQETSLPAAVHPGQCLGGSRLRGTSGPAAASPPLDERGHLPPSQPWVRRRVLFTPFRSPVIRARFEVPNPTGSYRAEAA